MAEPRQIYLQLLRTFGVRKTKQKIKELGCDWPSESARKNRPGQALLIPVSRRSKEMRQATFNEASRIIRQVAFMLAGKSTNLTPTESQLNDLMLEALRNEVQSTTQQEAIEEPKTSMIEALKVAASHYDAPDGGFSDPDSPNTEEDDIRNVANGIIEVIEAYNLSRNQEPIYNLVGRAFKHADEAAGRNTNSSVIYTVAEKILDYYKKQETKTCPGCCVCLSAKGV
jgi:hypothetical protein